MGGMIAAPDRDPFALMMLGAIIALQQISCAPGLKKTWKCNNPRRSPAAIGRNPCLHHLPLLATEKELSDFLKSVEKRAFKRSYYHVRNEESALDIVQDSMMKLAQHYGDKPPNELPMLYQRILSNCTLDWFRRQKTHRALFSSMGEFVAAGDDGAEFDALEALSFASNGEHAQSTEDLARRAQTFHQIEDEIARLPPRQREAFLMRYWEEMDVAETAAAMGCSEGSVKTHCFRAVQTLGKALKAKGIEL
jgi:RNA polymerase sigma-70 factor (ECF subfamily)